MATIFLLVLALIGFAVVLFQTQRRLTKIQDRLDDLEAKVFSSLDDMIGTPNPGSASRTVAQVTSKRSVDVVSQAPPPSPVGQTKPDSGQSKPSPQSRFANVSFENLVGGKLPIWVGGISLVFAGFFLVRYTIDAGLFGPDARSVAATIFAAAMIAISELGGRIPKVGASFTADPRVGQSLAGAGVATLYGTLYMAAEIYGLLGVPTAFILVVLVTAIAFALSLRHGPPTALMGLAGGFAAPWVAGMGASNLTTLLLYLAVFIAALFGLAIWRRWLWLLVLASGGGLAWSMAMLVTTDGSLGLLGGFIAATGGGAIVAAKRFGWSGSRWGRVARYAPLGIALVQLALLLPKMEYSATAWLLYFALSALTIALSWRDRTLLPLVAGALALAFGPLAGTWSEVGTTYATVAATFGVALLFGVAGHVGSRILDDDAQWWALVGIAAPVLCWFAGWTGDAGEASRTQWGMAAILSAIPNAYVAWEWHRQRRLGLVQFWAITATALMVWMACANLFDAGYTAIYSAVVALAVAAWARVTGSDAHGRVAIIPLAVAMVTGAGLSFGFFETLIASLSGERIIVGYLPPIAVAMRATLIPGALILAMNWTQFFAAGGRTRIAAFAVGGAGVAAFVWLLAKQIAFIATPADFIRLGFAERAIFTQILFGLGLVALSRTSSQGRSSLAAGGWVFVGVAVFRVVWFDFVLLNPLIVPQSVGPVTVANLGTAHMALIAMWLWLAARYAPTRFVLALQSLSLGAMVVTVLITIRQAVQGRLLAGAGIETGENYLYSAGLLVLTLAWLSVGIRKGNKFLRIAGLLVLTILTFKVFLIDAAELVGVLRILSFLGLGIALIGIGWAYGRVMGVDKAVKAG